MELQRSRHQIHQVLQWLFRVQLARHPLVHGRAVIRVIQLLERGITPRERSQALPVLLERRRNLGRASNMTLQRPGVHGLAGRPAPHSTECSHKSDTEFAIKYRRTVKPLSKPHLNLQADMAVGGEVALRAVLASKIRYNKVINREFSWDFYSGQ